MTKEIEQQEPPREVLTIIGDIMMDLFQPSDHFAPGKNGEPDTVQIWPLAISSYGFDMTDKVDSGRTFVASGRASIVVNPCSQGDDLEVVIAIQRDFFDTLAHGKIAKSKKAAGVVCEWAWPYFALEFLSKNPIDILDVHEGMVFLHTVVHKDHLVSFTTGGDPYLKTVDHKQYVPCVIRRTISDQILAAVLTDVLQSVAAVGFYDVKNLDPDKYSLEHTAPVVLPYRRYYHGVRYYHSSVKLEGSISLKAALTPAEEGMPEAPAQVAELRTKLFKIF